MWHLILAGALAALALALCAARRAAASRQRGIPWRAEWGKGELERYMERHGIPPWKGGGRC